jgi:hypothetical protein
MAALDYTAIQDGLVAMLQANVAEAKNVYNEGMMRDVGNISKMPLINVRLIESSDELTSMPNGYYERVTLNVDVIAFDFTSFKEAATLRDTVLKAAKSACRQNNKFAPGIETSSVQSQTTFGASEIEGQQGHVAMATFTVIVEAYVEP